MVGLRRVSGQQWYGETQGMGRTVGQQWYVGTEGSLWDSSGMVGLRRVSGTAVVRWD